MSSETASADAPAEGLGLGRGPGPFVPPVRAGESDVPEPGPFPVEHLSPAQRGIAEATAEVHGIDPALPAMATLATLAASAGKGLLVTGAVSGRETHCNLFVIAAAPKSYGKGAAAGVVGPLTEASKRRAEEYRTDTRPGLRQERAVSERRAKILVEWLARGRGENNRPLTDDERADLGRELAELERRLAAIAPLLESEPTLWVGSYTGAALATALARNGEALLSFSPEAGDAIRIALGRFSKDSKADFDLFLSGYTVEDWNEGRVTRGSINIRPCLSVLWLCQPSLLREMLSNEEAIQRGMTARFLMFAVGHETIPHDDGVPRFIPGEAVGRWARVIETGLQVRDLADPLRLECGPDAREIFRRWHNESVDLRNGRFSDIEGELGRWRENAVRIAACLALADAADEGLWPRAVSVDCAARAVGLCRWAVFSTLRLMQAGRMDRLNAMAEKLSKALGDCGGIRTLRDLDHHNGIPTAETRMLANAFPNRFSVTRQKGAGAGRPAEICILVAAPGES
ncbi:MAG TPA: DUF3987 domain-containing protein [Verrucomicrobiae bacterium]|nr:DUF3987 domain-containing protein [Verrucomicrobiae bacterium]